MNCGEFEHVLPDYLEGTQNPEQQAHLNSCRACSDLLSDLNLISSQAILLRASDEPSPRVWNSLESQLRREGIIHGAGVPQRSSVWHESLMRWRMARSSNVSSRSDISGCADITIWSIFCPSASRFDNIRTCSQ